VAGGGGTRPQFSAVSRLSRSRSDLEATDRRLGKGLRRRQAREQLPGFAEERLFVPGLQRATLQEIQTLLGVRIVGEGARLPQPMDRIEGILLGGAQFFADAREDEKEVNPEHGKHGGAPSSGRLISLRMRRTRSSWTAIRKLPSAAIASSSTIQAAVRYARCSS
jgi:hypothetical protein